jgi:hypothetical protein
VGTVYAQMDHRFCRRWAVLTDPEETLGASGAGVKVQYTTSCHVKKLLHVCKQVGTNLFTSCRQVMLALLVPICCNKFGASC